MPQSLSLFRPGSITDARVKDMTLPQSDGYAPSEALCKAVDVAIMLGRPLLLMGPPGTGKTVLAQEVADFYALPLRSFETKSSSQARDLFYTYDSLSAFKTAGAVEHRNFLEYQALGRAILDAFPGSHAQRQKLVEGEWDHVAHRSVVLIDEIDKAPRDFPNDLLTEIDRLTFRVPELGNLVSPGSARDDKIASETRPIIIITSNDERGLPAAFLRRCIFFHIDFPEPDTMRNIVITRLEAELKMAKGASLPVAISDLIGLFYTVRSALNNVGPSTAELLDWLRYLQSAGLDPDVPLVSQNALLAPSASIIAKSPDALKRTLAAFTAFVDANG